MKNQKLFRIVNFSDSTDVYSTTTGKGLDHIFSLYKNRTMPKGVEFIQVTRSVGGIYNGITFSDEIKVLVSCHPFIACPNSKECEKKHTASIYDEKFDSQELSLIQRHWEICKGIVANGGKGCLNKECRKMLKVPNM